MSWRTNAAKKQTALTARRQRALRGREPVMPKERGGDRRPSGGQVQRTRWVGGGRQETGWRGRRGRWMAGTKTRAWGCSRWRATAPPTCALVSGQTRAWRQCLGSATGRSSEGAMAIRPACGSGHSTARAWLWASRKGREAADTHVEDSRRAAGRIGGRLALCCRAACVRFRRPPPAPVRPRTAGDWVT